MPTSDQFAEVEIDLRPESAKVVINGHALDVTQIPANGVVLTAESNSHTRVTVEFVVGKFDLIGADGWRMSRASADAPVIQTRYGTPEVPE